MFRIAAVLLVALALASAAEAAPLKLERVVVVMRHGVRPPIQTNAELAKWSDKPWPAWPVPPGELTPHGGQTVALMGDTLRAAYRAKGLLPRTRCAGPGAVTVWADGADERTRETGEILARALQPGCGVKAAYHQNPPGEPRDPIFGGYKEGPCAITSEDRRLFSPPTDADMRQQLLVATDRLQAILAPEACSGGAGTCFARTPPESGGASWKTGGLAEDLLLEYVDGKPMPEVGWGRAGRAGVVAVMPLHERMFESLRLNTAASRKMGATMTRVIFEALQGRPVSGGPQSGPDLKLMGLAGHDTNLVLMASVFGLSWKLPDEPDGTAPSSALAFELWTDGTTEYVKPVIYYETLDQLRTLTPARARALPLQFDGCASGPNGSCPLATLEQRVLPALPSDCTA